MRNIRKLSFFGESFWPPDILSILPDDIWSFFGLLLLLVKCEDVWVSCCSQQESNTVMCTL